MEHLHFIGIGGTGMSAVARILLEMGYLVSGSDLATSEMTERLARLGARISIGHRPENLQDADLVVISSAVPEDNEELVAARARGIRVLHRAEMLGRLMGRYRSVAVAGSHGKTTTTSMISVILERLGLDPTVVIGGELHDIGGNAKLGRGEHFVAEADESDGSFLKLRPALVVVTNIDDDHLNNYGGQMERLAAAFLQFINGIPPDGVAVLCLDDPWVRRLQPQITAPQITYGLGEGAELVARNVQLLSLGAVAEVYRGGQHLGSLRLQVPGRHNVSNALAALGVGLFLGLPFAEMAAALSTFTGVERRFQTLALVDGIRVVDDYGHHPSEIKATLAAARLAAAGRLIVIFQPHRYTRTLLLAEEFGGAFTEADEIIVTDIYPAGEEPIPGVSGRLIAAAIARHKGRPVSYLTDTEEIIAHVFDLVRPGDLVLTIGAGNIWQIGMDLARRLTGRKGVGHGGFTTVGETAYDTARRSEGE